MDSNNLFLLKQETLITASDIPALTIIGAGAIGSCAALSISKMGPSRLRIIDFDTVSEHNVGNQLFGPEHVGQTKAQAVSTLIDQVTGQEIETIEGAFPDDLIPGTGILICCADSMDIRREALKEARSNRSITHLIESRMGAKYLEIYTLPTDDKEILDHYYENSLSEVYEAAIVPHQGCVEPGIFYTAMIAGSLIAAAVDHITRKVDYPHLLQFDLEYMQLIPVRYQIKKKEAVLLF